MSECNIVNYVSITFLGKFSNYLEQENCKV